MGVEPEYFPFMGIALMETLREMLDEQTFTPDVEKSWSLVYNVLAGEMCCGMQSDKIVLHSWSQLKKIPGYKEQTGLLLFHHLFTRYPESKLLFGFPGEFIVTMQNLKSSTKFRMHADYFILMFEKALHMVEAKTL